MARGTRILADAQRRTGISVVSGEADQLLTTLTADVIQTRVDLIHYPLIYYFDADVERAALPNSLGDLYVMAQGGMEEGRPPSVRLGATMLLAALGKLAKTLADRFVKANPECPADVFRAFGRDHLADKESEGSEE